MANTFEMSGKVKVMFEPMTFPSGFVKREFVLTTEDEYPQQVKFVCVKEKCALLDFISSGDEVKVTFRMRGNLVKDRYFVDLQAFRVDKIAGSAPADSDMPWGEPSAPEDDYNPLL